ncbi:unnamed protein product [Pleuronectes platessa]|uniref:Uncharacterized protein n=1 Tax=Pleuronectes platessa TaxID=8262 RepID=A0A9N7US98_PLEPL|nr:unnamed protein product [Pleuronectes platessa]
MWPRKGKSGAPCLSCYPRDPTPDKRMTMKEAGFPLMPSVLLVFHSRQGRAGEVPRSYSHTHVIRTSGINREKQIRKSVPKLTFFMPSSFALHRLTSHRITLVSGALESVFSEC